MAKHDDSLELPQIRGSGSERDPNANGLKGVVEDGWGDRPNYIVAGLAGRRIARISREMWAEPARSLCSPIDSVVCCVARNQRCALEKLRQAGAMRVGCGEANDPVPTEVAACGGRKRVGEGTGQYARSIVHSSAVVHACVHILVAVRKPCSDSYVG